ncbi:Helix-turn-helix domain-containing protein [Brevibacterium sp. 239c]|uniref:helix-turn-helix domain-containing protein n=1 Tax=Brevibacterium sp. 239c TaxID=1965356 RepID=UPI000C548C35|nr:Helix-turn-helix domain-containing protein [Brevibacterium sp. 239c]
MNLGVTAGREIQRLREESGLSQRDLAEQVELDPSTLSRLESGRSRWTIDLFVACCHVLGVNPGEVLADCVEKSEFKNTSLWEK